MNTMIAVMADITQAQFYAALQELRNHLDTKHMNLRESMESAFGRLDTKLDQHAREDAIVADRVLVIETQRKEEARLALKKGTWAGIIAGAAVSITVKLLDYWGRP